MSYVPISIPMLKPMYTHTQASWVWVWTDMGTDRAMGYPCPSLGTYTLGELVFVIESSVDQTT